MSDLRAIIARLVADHETLVEIREIRVLIDALLDQPLLADDPSAVTRFIKATSGAWSDTYSQSLQTRELVQEGLRAAQAGEGK